MNGAVMDAAKRHREFIAGLTAERPWLHISKMMRLPAGAGGDRRALRQQSKFDNAARHDHMRKTLVGLVSRSQLAASSVFLTWTRRR